MIKFALAYYFKKSTLEIKKFLPKHKYCNISKEIDGIMYYSGRILPDQKVENKLSVADVSYDLSEKTFCVPMVDRLSPVAYAISDEVHWNSFDVRHGGIESVLREVQCISYLIGGRKLVKDIKRSCIRCRILNMTVTFVSLQLFTQPRLTFVVPSTPFRMPINGLRSRFGLLCFVVVLLVPLTSKSWRTILRMPLSLLLFVFPVDTDILAAFSLIPVASW